MAASKTTKKYKRAKLILSLVSILLNIVPLATYIIKSMINADLIHEKIGLSMTVLIVLILTIVSFINKITLRSSLWILLIGLYLCLDAIMVPLIIIAVCQIIDELFISPIKNYCKVNVTVNAAIDKRLDNG